MTPQRPEDALVRSHVITGGRAYPTRNTLDLVTLVAAATDTFGHLEPEKRRVMRLCQDGTLSVAEIAGHLRLPVTVTKVLVSDLIDSGDLAVRSSARPQSPDPQLLQDVLDGLTRL